MANDFGLKPAPRPGRRQGEKKHWPAWYFGPDEGQKAVFNGPDEVPEGWATNRGLAQELRRQRAPADKDLMPREDIIAELKQRDIRFDFTKPTGELWQLLRDVRDHEGPLTPPPLPTLVPTPVITAPVITTPVAVAPGAPGGGPAAYAADYELDAKPTEDEDEDEDEDYEGPDGDE